MNLTLHGLPGLIFAFLACAGVATIACGISDWLADRFTADVRHLRVHRRQVRPGVNVDLGNGWRAHVSEIVRGFPPGDIAVISQYRDGDDDCEDPEWMPVADLAVKEAA